MTRKQTPPGDAVRSGRTQASPLLVALLAALAAPMGAVLLEAWLGLGQDWISDVILSVAFFISTYLGLDLRATRTRASSLERTQIGIDAQLSLAAQIQRNLLPQAPGPRGGCRFGALMHPAGMVGGDLYDFVETEGSVLFILGDVSGKGVPAALLMTATRAFFRTITRETKEPEEVVGRLSRALYDDNHGMPYLTCVVARLDLADRRLTHVNAGHPPSVVDDGREIRALAVGGPPAGMFPEARYESETLPLKAGDVLVAVSDGITETIESTGSDLGSALRALRAAEGGPPSPDRICRYLMEASEARDTARGSPDDRTIVALAVQEGRPLDPVAEAARPHDMR